MIWGDFFIRSKWVFLSTYLSTTSRDLGFSLLNREVGGIERSQIWKCSWVMELSGNDTVEKYHTIHYILIYLGQILVWIPVRSHRLPWSYFVYPVFDWSLLCTKGSSNWISQFNISSCPVHVVLNDIVLYCIVLHRSWWGQTLKCYWFTGLAQSFKQSTVESVVHEIPTANMISYD